MDMKFFNEAMQAVGLNPTYIGFGETYTVFRHVSQTDGRVITYVEDNDDDDDGVPDKEVARYKLEWPSLEAALNPPYDKSHKGFAGRKVTVFLNGKEIH